MAFRGHGHNRFCFFFFFRCQPRIRCSLVTRKMLVTGLVRSPSHLYLETLTPLMRLLSSSFYFARVGRPKHLIFDCMSSLLLILASFFSVMLRNFHLCRRRCAHQLTDRHSHFSLRRFLAQPPLAEPASRETGLPVQRGQRVREIYFPGAEPFKYKNS